jgi:hypothetical protein
MSVSYVVPVWRQDTYERVSRPWLLRQVDEFGAELIEIRGQRSIFDAQESGRQKARFRYIVYVHDDVRLIRPLDLTPQIVAAFVQFPRLGLIGPVGKIEKKRVPWWLNAGPYVGNYCRRGNDNEVVYQFANEAGGCPFREVVGDPATDLRTPRWDRFAPAGLVDGFYLAEDHSRLNVPWDTETYGEQWHGYDADRCYQAHELGLEVMVAPWLFLHDNAGHAGYKGTDPKKIHGRDQANRRINSAGDALWLADLEITNSLLREKWGVA